MAFVLCLTGLLHVTIKIIPLNCFKLLWRGHFCALFLCLGWVGGNVSNELALPNA